MTRLRLRSTIRALRRCEEGISAAEFGLMLPVMLMLLVASMEFAHAFDNYRKVTQLARTVSDLTAQGDTANPMATATLNDILASSKLVLTPFDSTKAKIVVSAMGVYPTTLNKQPYVCSSVGSNATARSAKAAAADLTVPAPFQTSGARYLFTEVSMPYTPMLGSALIRLFKSDASYTFSVSMAWPVRGGAAYKSTSPEIILPGGAYCPVL